MTKRIFEITLDDRINYGKEVTWKERQVKELLVKMNVLAHYGKGKLACAQCGFDDLRALSIDHINGGGMKHRKEVGGGGFVLYKWLQKHNYPTGYQTLCMNCQWVKMMSSLGHPMIKVK